MYNDIFNYIFPNKPVLIMGKGPSLKQRHRIDEKKYLTIGINHVRGCDINHCIDWNALDFSQKMVIAPFYPLLNNEVHDLLVPNLPWVWGYNFYTNDNVTSSPKIYNKQFSIHCILHILGLKGIKKIRTLGVDGGHIYHDGFKHLVARKEGYDDQFKGIYEIVDEYKMDFHAL